ncbi:MAG: ATPase, partial [Novosphingobium sp.]
FAEEAEVRSRKAQEAQTAHAARIDVLIGGINERLSAKAHEHEALLSRVSDHSLAMAAQLDDSGARIAAITAQAGQAESALGNSLQTLSLHVDHSRDTIGNVSDATARLTDDSVRLLELLQASAAQSREQLPLALSAGEEKLAEIESRIAALVDTIAVVAARSDTVATSLAETRQAIGQSLGEIGALQGGIEQGAGRHAKQLRELKESLELLDSESSRIAEFSSGELTASLNKLTAAAREAVGTIEQAGRQSVAALAEKLGDESAAAIERVLKTRTAEAVGALDLAAGNAAESSREAAVHLRDQLARIDELAGNLERRVTQARERAEEQIDSDFSRRVALITESLNSNAIDIAKALSSDVTDISWASYLRGDRGVFTRRAVRLLDSQEARSIAQVYGEDREFREHVSRYIHDFEAMLRQMLSTRDGHALGVTLLSSDMGKLYVALAQAIERLRD